MTRLRKRGEIVREFILEHIENDGQNIVQTTMDNFKITRQAVYKHLRNLKEQGCVVIGVNGLPKLGPQEKWDTTLSIAENVHEDVVWRTIVAPKVGRLSDNALSIWSYGFTEIYNNVVDHSGSDTVWIEVEKTALTTNVVILDRGIGIFTKIKTALDLLDERHAVLELTKGKLTTDPASHTGEGIFFTSRMFDMFSILSGEVFLSHSYGKDEDWILQNSEYCKGTWITMKLKNNTSRTTKEVFDGFKTGDEIGFTKTVVPVRLALYGNEQLISRSQGKRLMERVDRFKTVILDFAGVQTVGRAFADEIFRVFANRHPNIQIIPVNDGPEVKSMIVRAHLQAFLDKQQTNEGKSDISSE